MLIAHKIIDAVRGRDPRHTFRSIEGTDPKYVNNLIGGIEEAEKFDFGRLLLEKNESGKYVLPDLTTDEKEFWVSGYIPLPAPMCWFEYILGDKRNGLFVTELSDDLPWTVMRVTQDPGEFLFDGAMLAIRRREQDWNKTAWQYLRYGNKMINYDRSEVEMSIAADIMLSIYLTLMINSKSTEVHREPAPERLNKARTKNKQTPLFEHRIVNIVPNRYLRHAEREAQGTHSSPRLHWRRTHLRHFDHPTPQAKRLADDDWAVLIPRQIIGRAEHGTVSHEYRVKRNGDA